MKKNIDKFILIALLAITLFLAFYIVITLIPLDKNKDAIGSKQRSFQTLISNENNVEFQVTPLNPSQFQIEINTHSVDLDFDLKEISKLYDDIGNSYKPLKWEGSEPGGHHRNGILKFASINKNAKSIKLVINYGIERVFNWNIK